MIHSKFQLLQPTSSLSSEFLMLTSMAKMCRRRQLAETPQVHPLLPLVLNNTSVRPTALAESGGILVRATCEPKTPGADGFTHGRAVHGYCWSIALCHSMVRKAAKDTRDRKTLSRKSQWCILCSLRCLQSSKLSTF